ncbi:MOSC domain-containing protein [Pseudoruegeria sp. SK021]|uniref:MOSC domain-containing protein n=1 Tax=Pseudoruegeria sp. SK021 TaxID=1933035 RepID=UPI000A235A69|nr:MOSC N-terminal beta barrel domain-containing protein [Pseudoruegeria sp. SK021]OSP55167.1 molybdenum cofactor biosysynthesis protein [Pseudoruegeria sp. SK021]
MTATLAAIWRHPIKAHGSEALTEAALVSGEALPWDRVWAVAHEAAKVTDGSWVPCANFSRGAKAPQLMAITARLNDATGQITLTHPARPDLTFDPDRDSQEFLEWVAPLMPADRAASVRIVRATGQAMTDSRFPSISITSLASLEALSERVGTPLAQTRFRGNLWLAGLAPWQEFDLVGRTLEIGGARVDIRERIGRCLATTANPTTGERDADTLAALKSGWGHTDFGVYGVVTRGGTVRLNDPVRILS